MTKKLSSNMIHTKKQFNMDGQSEILFQETHNFLKDGQKIQRRIYDGKGRLRLHAFFIYYPNNLLKATHVKDANGKLRSVVQLFYDDKSHLVKREFLDHNLQLLAYHLWKYDPGNKHLLEYRKVGKDGHSRFRKKYIYDPNGRLIKEEHFNDHGELAVVKIKSYDQNGLEIEESVFNHQKDLITQIRTLYNHQNLPSEISWYDANARLQRLECFNYSQEGILQHEIILDFYASRSFFKSYNQTGQIEYVLRKQGGKAVAEEVYSYDQQNRIISRIRYSILNDQRKAVEKEVHTYQIWDANRARPKLRNK